VERPDYETYVKKLETRSRIDEELLEIEKQEEAKRLAEEKAKKIAESKVEKTEEIIVEEIVEDKIPVSVHD
jgi:predicted house-cleaning NTP pyrophosphatase (Maf/HAM1 superfamily)